MIKQYLCECQICKAQNPIQFDEDSYLLCDEQFEAACRRCHQITMHQRIISRKKRAAIHRNRTERDLRQSIMDKCDEYGFTYRFVYQSVVITTPLSDWSFDYHQSKKTLYHESTTKINFKTGNYSKTHCQFRDRWMKPLDVIDYVARHDRWRAEDNEQKRVNEDDGTDTEKTEDNDNAPL